MCSTLYLALSLSRRTLIISQVLQLSEKLCWRGEPTPSNRFTSLIRIALSLESLEERSEGEEVLAFPRNREDEDKCLFIKQSSYANLESLNITITKHKEFIKYFSYASEKNRVGFLDVKKEVVIAERGQGSNFHPHDVTHKADQSCIHKNNALTTTPYFSF